VKNWIGWWRFDRKRGKEEGREAERGLPRYEKSSAVGEGRVGVKCRCRVQGAGWVKCRFGLFFRIFDPAFYPFSTCTLHLLFIHFQPAAYISIFTFFNFLPKIKAGYS